MWKPIKDWEWYLVNEHGEVFNSKTNKLIVGDYNSTGYPRVCLYNHDKHKRFFRHRLVAEYFIPNPHGLPEVNHKDGDKKNYHVDNLEWCSKSENEIHAWDTHLKTYNSGMIPNKPFEVTFFDGTVKRYESQRSCAKELGVSQMSVSDWLSGEKLTYIKHNIESIEFINV